MGKVELWLRRLVDSPKRHLIVIIVTCGIGLLLGWPAADEYFALGEHRVQLLRSLEQARQLAAQLGRLEQMAAERSQELAQLEKRTVTEQQIHDFRSELAELVRQSGCRLRRIDLEAPRRRKWQERDHPLKTPQTKTATQTAQETTYDLRSQRILLSIAGPLTKINELLGRVHASQRMMHTRTFALRPSGEQRTEVLLEWELIVFDLENPLPPT